MKQPIEEYLKRLKDFGYTQEQLEAVREFRESEEVSHMTWEQYLFFRENSMIKSSRKLKKPRNLFVFENKIWYLEHYVHEYMYCAEFMTEEDE